MTRHLFILAMFTMNARDGCRSQPLVGDAQDPQHGPSPNAATKLAQGNNAPAPMEAVQSTQEQVRDCSTHAGRVG